MYGIRAGVCPGVGLRGELDVLPTHLVELSIKSVRCIPFCSRHSVFAPASSEMAVRLFGLCIFCPEFAPTAHAQSYFWSHIIYLYFVSGGEVCPGANTAALQQRIPVCPTLLAPPYLFPPYSPCTIFPTLTDSLNLVHMVENCYCELCIS